MNVVAEPSRILFYIYTGWGHGPKSIHHPTKVFHSQHKKKLFFTSVLDIIGAIMV